jgi:probable blue pigment (indigoidine) exporter
MLWGTTYIVFTETLPTDHPLLVSSMRALSAGLLMLLLVRRLPPLSLIIPVTVLALTNIGFFFALLMISAARLPGGITATLAACQPLLVALLAWPLLGRMPQLRDLATAALGMGGVGIMVLTNGLSFDPIGILTGLAAASSMALGIVLMERWRHLAQPIDMVTWQLLIAGILLLPVALLVEGRPAQWDLKNTAGLAYLAICVTALAYWLWVRGIQVLGSQIAVLAFLSPVTALILGVLFLQEVPTLMQTCGVALVFLSIGLSMARTPPPKS